MYKDKEKQKATNKDRQRRDRKGVTKDEGVTALAGVMSRQRVRGLRRGRLKTL